MKKKTNIIFFILIMISSYSCRNTKSTIFNSTINPNDYIELLLIPLKDSSQTSKEDIVIKLSIKNKTDKIMYVNDPKYYTTIITSLYLEDKELAAVKIKPILKNIKSRVKLNPNQSYTTSLNYSLNYLYGSLGPGSYKLRIYYNGYIFNSEEQNITMYPIYDKIKSNIINFSIQ